MFERLICLFRGHELHGVLTFRFCRRCSYAKKITRPYRG